MKDYKGRNEIPCTLINLQKIPKTNGSWVRDTCHKRIKLITIRIWAINDNNFHHTITDIAGPDYHQIKKLNFGDYIKMYDIKRRTNTNTEMIVEATLLFSS